MPAWRAAAPICSPACRWRIKTYFANKAGKVAAAAKCWAILSLRIPPLWCKTYSMQAWSRWGAPIWTNLPWAPPTKPRFTAPPATHGNTSMCPAALPAARPPWWRRGWHRPHWAATPAAPSASRLRIAASPASSPPTAWCPALAWWPMLPASTKPGRWHKPPKTAPCCSTAWPVLMCAIPPA